MGLGACKDHHLEELRQRYVGKGYSRELDPLPTRARLVGRVWFRADTFGDFPRDSWGTVLPRVLLIGSCGFLHFCNFLTHKLNVCA